VTWAANCDYVYRNKKRPVKNHCFHLIVYKFRLEMKISFLHTYIKASASHQRAVWWTENLWISHVEWYSWVVLGGRNCFLKLSTLRRRQLHKTLSAASETLVLWKFHVYIYGLCSTVLIALTLQHEQMHILSLLQILISLLSTGRNVFLHVSPWLQSLIYRNPPFPLHPCQQHT
jgi:hypothetical protein